MNECVQIHRREGTHERKDSAVQGFCSETGWQHAIHLNAVEYASQSSVEKITLAA